MGDRWTPESTVTNTAIATAFDRAARTSSVIRARITRATTIGVPTWATKTSWGRGPISRRAIETALRPDTKTAIRIARCALKSMGYARLTNRTASRDETQ